MAELIDRRDIVFAHKVEGSEEYKEGFLDGAMCVLDAIDEMSTIDAKPVVHAHWIEHREFYEDEGFEGYYYSCSNCDGTLYGDIEDFNFCHCCGAQMDEKGE